MLLWSGYVHVNIYFIILNNVTLKNQCCVVLCYVVLCCVVL